MDRSKVPGIGESADLYQAIFENFPFIVFTLDRDGNIVNGNRYAEKLIGMKLKDVKGKSFSKIGLLGKRDLVKALIEFRKNLKGKVTEKTVYNVKTRDGREMLVGLIGIPLKEKGSVKEVLIVGENITEQKEAEAEIRASEESLKQLVDLAPDGIISVDLKGKITSCNLAFVKMTGFRKKEIIGRNFIELPILRKRDIPKYVKVFTSVVRGKIPEPFEFEWVRKDGSLRKGEIRVGIMKAGGKMTGIQAFVNDITERNRAEEEIRSSEERMRVIFENSPDAMYINDLKGNFIDGNAMAEKMIGYKRNEIVGKNMAKLGILSKRDIPRVLKLIAENAAGRSTGPDEFELIRKDGSGAKVEIRTHPVKIEGRTVVLGVARDMSERERAERALSESERRFQEIVENAQEWIWEVDPKGMYTYSNGLVEEILGYRPEEIVGKMHFFDMFHPKDRESLKKTAFGAFSKKERFRSFVNRNVHKNGRVVWLSTSGVPILSEKGRLMGYRGSDVDVTEQKTAEERIRKERDRAKLYLDIAGVIFLTTDTKGNVTLINQKGCEILGYRQDEISGKSWVENFLPERIRPEFREYAKGVVSGETEVMEYHENPVLTKSGEERMIAWHNKLIRDDKGKIVGHLSSGEDITEKKEKEETLKRRTEESEKFARLSVGRELKMVELKKKVKRLEDILKKRGIEVEGKGEGDL